MANQEQLEILKQGVEVWNKCRRENPLVEPDFREANLIKANLKNADFRFAYLRRAGLNEANFRRADLFKAVITGANLIRANLSRSDLTQARLIGSDLTGAELTGAVLSRANLSRAVLCRASLVGADLSKASISETNFSSSRFGETILADLDLEGAIGLKEAKHQFPSTIGTNTLALSKGKIPDVFLRGCGLSDWEIEMAKLYNPDLRNDEFIDIQNRIFDLRNRQAIQISPLFISYSHADGKFVDKVGDNLTEKGIRYWRDIHDMKAGRIEKQIDRAIRHNPTVLLVLSERSVQSDWVEHEVRTARELEKELERDTLCPVALDDSWKDSPWPK